MAKYLSVVLVTKKSILCLAWLASECVFSKDSGFNLLSPLRWSRSAQLVYHARITLQPNISSPLDSATHQFGRVMGFKELSFSKKKRNILVHLSPRKGLLHLSHQKHRIACWASNDSHLRNEFQPSHYNKVQMESTNLFPHFLKWL